MINIHRDTIYIRPDHTLEFWEHCPKDDNPSFWERYEKNYMFVVENKEGLYYKLYPSLQSWYDFPKTNYPLNQDQYDGLEKLSIDSVIIPHPPFLQLSI